jgi:hypothetical protein
MEYARQGYLPEAMVNFLALLGWSPGSDDRELFTRDELVRSFALEGISGGNAVFNPEKLDWFNQQHIMRRRQIPATGGEPRAAVGGAGRARRASGVLTGADRSGAARAGSRTRREACAADPCDEGRGHRQDREPGAVRGAGAAREGTHGAAARDCIDPRQLVTADDTPKSTHLH